MATAIAPSFIAGSPLSQVKVNVRLCGSIPRQEMEALSLKQYHSRLHAAANTIDSDSVADVLCSQLSLMQHQQQRQPQSSIPQQRLPPTYEPPSWAVPADGEARLEVSTKMLPSSIIPPLNVYSV
jgi:hypothetical protein